MWQVRSCNMYKCMLFCQNQGFSIECVINRYLKKNLKCIILRMGDGHNWPMIMSSIGELWY